MPAIARGVSRRAFIGTYGALLKSNVQGRGKSFAASVPCGSYKPQKGQKKSKEERRAMIESFVDKYRASNAEKFPSASHTRQELGGSFYVIREIIQELQCNHRMSLSNKIEDAPSVSLKMKSEIDISQSASGQRESNTTDVNTTKLSQDMDSLNGVKQMGNHETPKTEKLHCEQLIGSEHGESSPKTASFWENLRSLRDGIINFWKKM